MIWYGLVLLVPPLHYLRNPLWTGTTRLALLLFDVNRNTTSNWQCLLCTYQGLGLPNMHLHKLAAMLHHILQHRGMGSLMDFQMGHVFESLQTEYALEGNTFLFCS